MSNLPVGGMTREEACADVTRLLQSLGTEAARRVVFRTVTEELHPDFIKEQVKDESRRLTDYLVAGGACAGDVDVACRVFVGALIAEGKRLTILGDFQGGTA